MVADEEKVPLITGNVGERMRVWERFRQKELLKRMRAELLRTNQAAIEAGHGDLLKEILEEETAQQGTIPAGEIAQEAAAEPTNVLDEGKREDDP